MLAMWEPRHAAVVARAGCVPPLVAIVRDSGHAGNREFAAALLASLSRSRDIQVEVAAAGGIPALVRCVGGRGREARRRGAIQGSQGTVKAFGCLGRAARRGRRASPLAAGFMHGSAT
jgi:hypothetical protein